MGQAPLHWDPDGGLLSIREGHENLEAASGGCAVAAKQEKSTSLDEQQIQDGCNAATSAMASDLTRLSQRLLNRVHKFQAGSPAWMLVRELVLDSRDIGKASTDCRWYPTSCHWQSRSKISSLKLLLTGCKSAEQGAASRCHICLMLRLSNGDCLCLANHRAACANGPCAWTRKGDGRSWAGMDMI